MEENNHNLKVEVIREMIKRRVEMEAEILISEAKEKLEKRVPEIIGGVVVELMMTQDVALMMERITFLIKDQNEKRN